MKAYLSKLMQSSVQLAIVTLLLLAQLVPLSAFWENTASADLAGPKSGSTFAGNIAAASGDHNWSNADNAGASDNSRATVQITSSSNVSNYLRATGFGLDIPAGSIIKGITVGIERSEANSQDATIRDNVVSLVKNNSVVGQNKAATAINWPTSDATASYGGTSDLWGTTWTPAEVNNANFGVVLSVGRTSGGDETARVDHITVAVEYTTPVQSVKNPDLFQACGLDMVLVIDNSASIDSGELTTMKNAAKSFVTALDGTPTEFSVLSFNTSASAASAFTADGSTLTGASGGAINAVATSNGYTNWEAALTAAHGAFPNRTDNKDLVIFITDGDPTANNQNSQLGPTDVPSIDANNGAPHLSPAISAANAIKADGIRIESIGIGTGGNPGSVARLTSISSADAVTTTDFAGLAGKLKDLAEKLCGGTITVEKIIDLDGQNLADKADQSPGADWRYTIAGSGAPIVMNTDNEGLLNTPVSVDSNGKTYSVTETLKPGFELVNASCNGAHNNGQFSLQTKAVEGVVVKPTNVVTCKFYNRPTEATIQVKKVVVNGPAGSDAQQFSYTRNGGNADTIMHNQTDSHTLTDVPAGGTAQTVVETNVPAGYTATYTNSENQNANCNNLLVKPAKTVVCTITNTYTPPKLTLQKVVENGGPADADDWKLRARAGQETAVIDTYPAVNGTVSADVEANKSYTLSEYDGPGGYTPSAWVCTGGNGNELQGDVVTLEHGENITCTIKNTYIDHPTLQLKKKVVDNWGGNAKATDWKLRAWNGQTYLINEHGQAAGYHTALTNIRDAVAGVEYILSETNGPNGYEASSWACTGGTLRQGYKLTLRAGEDVVCTITNTAKPPKLTVTKVVDNDWGGTLKVSDFKLYVDGLRVYSGQQNAFQAGWYEVGEIQRDGYKLDKVGGDCKVINNKILIKLEVGKQYSCTLENDDQPGSITLFKKVINDNGGSKRAHDFDLNIKGKLYNGQWIEKQDVDHGKAYNLPVGEYRITEDEKSNYQLISVKCFVKKKHSADTDDLLKGKYNDWSYIGPEQTYSDKTIKVGLALDQHLYCILVNDDIPPVVHVEKEANPSNTGEEFRFSIYHNNNLKANFGLSHGGVYHTTDNKGNSDLKDGDRIKIVEHETDNWFLTSANCKVKEKWHSGWYWRNLGTDFKVEQGKEYFCKFKNEKYGEVIVTKFDDINQNGKWDEGEPTLPGWPMELATEEGEPVNAVTGEDGVVVFGQLQQGTYVLSEDIEAQEGWEQSAISCGRESSNKNQHVIQVAAGQTVHCNVANFRAPFFGLAKANDKPNPVPVGTDVLYTLTLTVPEGSGRIYGQHCEEEESNIEALLFVQEVDETECQEHPFKIVDLPPENFEYVPGSFTANSNVRGDLKAQGITPDPAYASPGTWNITGPGSPFLTPGEIVTLTYLAKIGSVSPGTYPDFAHAVGFTGTGNIVLSNITPLNQTNPFVTSSVTVEEPEVLGLVDTGVDSRLVSVIATAIIVVAAALAMLSRRSSRALGIALIAGMAFVGVLGIAPKAEAAQFWAVNMSTPAASTSNATINVDWQVATALPEVNPGETFTVTLLQNGVPTGASQQVTNPNGNSGTFNVTFPAEGTYNLQVQAVSNQDAEAKTTPAAAVTYDATPPAAPAIVSTEQNGDTYTVTVQIPDGVEPGTIEFYASPNGSFTADNSTLVGTLNYVAGQTLTFTFTKPGAQQFIAIRTVDNNGNTSGFVTTRGAVVAAAAAGVIGDASATSSETEVLSDSEGTQEDQPAEDDGLSTAAWVAIILIALAAIGGGTYYYLNSQRSRD